ncbi:hypothetical protein [Rhizohabitans arisaemae]|uniref:hypothetical protein n=1 Tax=Rhizohabitans arisaemae TaxID=2720610 RepID=UPI0024B25FF7|nr:hypothetical protein [Rhizohabitans arisaemae]
MDMSVLGVSAEASEIYRYFLRRRGDGVGEARQALGIPPDRAEDLVKALAELSLLDITDRHRVIATEPRVGIERLIERRIDELNTEIRRVLAARDAIALLEDESRAGRDSAAALDIERVDGVDQVRRRMDDLGFFSYKHVLALYPGGPPTPAYIEGARRVYLRSLRRGLAVRCAYHPRVLADPAAEAWLHELTALGAQVRITEDPMDRLVIFDGVAVVATDPKESAKGALFVREPGLVSQLMTYFEGRWQVAVDLREHRRVRRSAAELSELEKRVLSVMATADKDEIAARELDVSVRTYRRYVADLMGRLGAVNRFQAALRAKEENWI